MAINDAQVGQRLRRCMVEAVGEVMTTATVTPAYGRDYKSARAAREAWESGADFILREYGNPFDGKPCNVEDIVSCAEYTHVNIRYSGTRRIVRVKL